MVKGQYTYYVHKCADAGRQVSIREEAIFANVEKVMGELAISEEFTYFMQNIVKLVIGRTATSAKGCSRPSRLKNGYCFASGTA